MDTEETAPVAEFSPQPDRYRIKLWAYTPNGPILVRDVYQNGQFGYVTRITGLPGCGDAEFSYVETTFDHGELVRHYWRGEAP